MAVTKAQIKNNQFASVATPLVATPATVASAREVPAPATKEVEPSSNNDAEMVRMSIYVKKNSKSVIEARAKATGTSVSQIISAMLDEYANKYEDFAKEYYQLQEKINAMNTDFANKML